MKDNWMLIAVIALSVVSVAISFIERKKRKDLMNELADLMMAGKFDEFDEKANSKKARRLIQPFNLDFMKLNSAVMNGDRKAADACFERFENVRLNVEQKSAVYMRGFYFYLAAEELKKAEEYYKKIGENRKEDQNDEINRLYDTYVLGGIKYLKKTEDEWENASENNKPALEALLVKMYENKGDTKQIEKFTELLKSHFD